MADGGRSGAAGTLLGIPGLDDPVEVGSGGFGTVYRARQPDFGRAVAVKVLREPLDDPAVRRRFERECKAMGALSGHPHIVTVYGGGLTATGKPYIVMDYLAQGSLADRLRARGPLPWQEVAEVAVKLASALETAHRAGVLHRDLKPENVLVSDFGEPKLADFGIAKVHGATATKTDALSLSVAHAAPELFEGVAPSVQSDLYSLGSTLFTLLSGRLAFVHDTDESLLPALVRISRDPVPDLRPEGVPEPICNVVERLMAKTPALRFASAEELGQVLQELQRRAGLPATSMALSGAGRVRPGQVTAHVPLQALPAQLPPRSPGSPTPVNHAPAPPQPAPAPTPWSPRPTAHVPDPDRSGRPVKLALAAIVGVLVLAAAGVALATVVTRRPASPGPVDGAPPQVVSPAAPSAPSQTEPNTRGSPGPTPVVSPVRLAPQFAQVTSFAPPGADASGRPVTYGPEQLIDGDPTTAWRTPGSGVGQEVRVVFSSPVRVRRIGLIPGYAKVDPVDGVDRFRQNRTVRTVRYVFDDGRSVTVDFAAEPALQFTDVDAVTGEVVVEILATSDHGGRDFTPISEIEVFGNPA